MADMAFSNKVALSYIDLLHFTFLIKSNAIKNIDSLTLLFATQKAVNKLCFHMICLKHWSKTNNMVSFCELYIYCYSSDMSMTTSM